MHFQVAFTAWFKNERFRVTLLRVVISAALVVVVIDTLSALIHCFDYDYDHVNECDPGLNQAKNMTRA